MKPIWGRFFIFIFLLASSCRGVTDNPSLTPTAVPSMTSTQNPVPISEPAATLTPVPAAALGGLIISSPILGAQLEDTNFQPPERFTVNGLGIINSDGTLTKFADAGLFESLSPSGVKIVYQHGYENEYADQIDDLYVYDAKTAQTTHILDDLENEGGKTVLAWLEEEQKFIYSNDYLKVLFEAYGYFGSKQLLLADATTGQTTILISDGHQFDVSPDQTQIAYTTGELLGPITHRDRELERFGCFQPRMYDIASSTSQAFDLGLLDEKPVCVGYPKWSPDGTKLAWVGYFEDDSFRPITFNLQDNSSTIHSALSQTLVSSRLPTAWFLGEPVGPTWIDNSIFWTPSYEVDVASGVMFTPREMELPYDPRMGKPLVSPDRSLHVILNDTRDMIVLTDGYESFLSTYLLDDLYKGPRQEILTSGFVLEGLNRIVAWSPFVPHGQ